MADSLEPEKGKEEGPDGYRALLISTAQKSQDDYDKTLLALAGGGIGVSMAFVKNVLPPEHDIVCAVTLFWAWCLWALTLFCLLLSFLFSHKAHWHAIKMWDLKKIDRKRPGGWYGEVTRWLNRAGFVLFILGLVLLLRFVYLNLLDAR